MALRAGYYGIKKKILSRLLPDYSTPGVMTNKELTASKVDWSSYVKTGVHNLNRYPYYEESKTDRGVTYTVNSDGSIELSGISTEYSEFSCNSREFSTCVLKAGSYILSGGINNKIRVAVGKTVNNAWFTLAISEGEDAQFTLTEDTQVGISVVVTESNVNTDGNIIYPMIRLATDPISEYGAYTMQNSDLTVKKYEVTAITSSLGIGAVMDDTYKYAFRQGNVVHFHVRFTTTEATNTSDHVIFNIGGLKPVIGYPLIAIRKRQAPYEETNAGYINPGGDFGFTNFALPAGTYDITGTYICK